MEEGQRIACAHWWHTVAGVEVVDRRLRAMGRVGKEEVGTIVVVESLVSLVLAVGEMIDLASVSQVDTAYWEKSY